MVRHVILALALACALPAALAGTCRVCSGDVCDQSTKTCYECQRECLGWAGCPGMTYNGEFVSIAELPTYACDDFPPQPEGVRPCTLLDAAGGILVADQKSCADCISACKGNAACATMVFNFESYPRSQLDTMVCPAYSPSNVLPLPTPSPELRIQCGGIKGAQCTCNGGSEVCGDEPWGTVSCPAGYGCVRESQDYWGCRNDGWTGNPKPVTVDPPATTTVGLYQQCGGYYGQGCAYAGGNLPCGPGQWSWVNCPAGSSCVASGCDYSQCRPN